MALRIACPTCSTVVKAPETAKTIACLKCGERVTLPETVFNSGKFEVVEEQPELVKPSRPSIRNDDRPRKRKVEKAPGLPAWVLAAPVVLLAVSIVGGFLAWQMMKKDKVAPPPTKPETVQVVKKEDGPPPVEWKAFTAPDNSFNAYFPNGEPQLISGTGDSGPPIPGVSGAVGQGGTVMDLAKQLGIEAGSTWRRADPLGTFLIGYHAMPNLLGNQKTFEDTFKELKVGVRPDGTEILKLETGLVGGYTGRRFLVKKGNQLVDTRMVKVKSRTFTAVVEVPFQAGEPVIVNQFFKAFVITNVPDTKPLAFPGLTIPPDLDPTKP